MSSLESSQCLHWSQINVFIRVKSISSLLLAVSEQGSQIHYKHTLFIFPSLQALINSTKINNISRLDISEMAQELG